MVKLTKHKRGWVRLVEVFVAILLLSSVLLVIVIKTNSNSYNEEYNEIYIKEKAILQNIQLNNSLRTAILNSNPLPVEWENFDSELKNRIIFLTPSNLECRAKICWLNDPCLIEDFSEGEIYAKSVVISADLDNYSPRQLKLFCSEKS